MKTGFIKCLIALFLSTVALPMMSQDYMNIYFKDGDFRKFYLKNITEITTSMFDAEGIQHVGYEYQHITTINNRYVYSLSNVDSITFTKCDEEQVKANLDATMPEVYSLLSECSNIIDVEENISNFKSIEGIEDAWSDGHELHVTIPDLGPVSFYFPHDIEEKETENAPIRTTSKIKEMINLTKSYGTEARKIKAVIANQNASILDNLRTDFDGLEDDFRFCDVDVEYNKTDPLLSFFLSDIYEYDLVFLKTHGSYDGQQHWLLTSSVLGESFFNPEGNEKKWAKFYENLLDTINSDRYKDKDLTYGKDVAISWPATEIGSYKACITVSESCIREKSDGKFQSNKSILFNGACESLLGGTSLADLFLDDRNLGVYFGYDNSNVGGPVAGCYLFRSLLKGKSVTKSYNDLPEQYRNEELLHNPTAHYIFKARLFPITRLSGKECNNLFLFPVYTKIIDEKEAFEQYEESHYLVLKGESKTLDPDAIVFGFEYGTDGNLDKNISDVQLAYYGTVDNILFQGKITEMEMDKTYSYRAYTYDGQNYNYGETYNFCIKTLELSTGSFCINIGETNTIYITGNGSYKINNGNDNSTTITQSGEELIIKAIGVGTSTITVTDNKTGQTASFTVTVTDPNSTDVSGEFIDLGLPSGTLWASYNLGATQPEEYGEYYAWGETEVKTKYFWSNYIQCNGSKETCYDLGPEISGTSYDAARTKWKGGWQLPTFEQFNELIYNCSYTWTTVNDVTGKMFTGPNGKTIFFPAAGYKANEVSNSGSYGYYWSGTQDPDNIIRAYNLSISEEKPRCLNNYRYAGFTIRPVISGLELSKSNTISMMENKEESIAIKSGSGNYTYEVDNDAIVTVSINKDIVTIKAMNAGDAIITLTDIQSGKIARIIVSVEATPVAVDLGLSVKWASCNIGAKNQEDTGYYYSWGETETKNEYWWSTYKYYNGSSDKLTKYCNNSEYGYDGFTDSNTILDPEDDIAHVKWGGNWRMPTIDEIKELLDNCTWDWTEQNGVEGYIVTSKIKGCEGNSIFIPVTGYRRGNEIKNDDYAYYWTSSLYTNNPEYAYNLPFGENSHNWNCGYRYAGCPIRPVESNITQEQ